MDWTKVITDPLGLAGFALALVFGFVARTRKPAWVMPVSIILAAVCIFGSLFLAYERVSSEKKEAGKKLEPVAEPPNSRDPPAAANSMKIDKIEQHVERGSAVSGLQGNVTINVPAPQNESKPKP